MSFWYKSCCRLCWRENSTSSSKNTEKRHREKTWKRINCKSREKSSFWYYSLPDSHSLCFKRRHLCCWKHCFCHEGKTTQAFYSTLILSLCSPLLFKEQNDIINYREDKETRDKKTLWNSIDFHTTTTTYSVSFLLFPHLCFSIVFGDTKSLTVLFTHFSFILSSLRPPSKSKTRTGKETSHTKWMNLEWM